MCGRWPDTLGNQPGHPLLDLFGSWRPNQIEHAKNLLMMLSTTRRHNYVFSEWRRCCPCFSMNGH
jgi:hypothetical protein